MVKSLRCRNEMSGNTLSLSKVECEQLLEKDSNIISLKVSERGSLLQAEQDRTRAAEH